MRMESGSTDRALRDELSRPGDRWMEHKVLEYLEGAIRGFRGRDQAIRLRQGNAHGLLQRDDLARRDGFQGCIQMQVVGQQDLDEVDLGTREQIVEIFLDGDIIEPPGRRAPPRPLGVAVAQGDDPRSGIGQVLDRVQIGDAAGPHDADSERPSAHWKATSRNRALAAMQSGTEHQCGLAMVSGIGRGIVQSVSGTASARKIGATLRPCNTSG